MRHYNPDVAHLSRNNKALILPSPASSSIRGQFGSNVDGGGSTAVLKHTIYNIRGMKDNHYIWYSDAFFAAPSTEYNPHLTSLSVYAAESLSEFIVGFENHVIPNIDEVSHIT